MSLAGFALPLLQRLDPERAHRLTVKALHLGLGPAHSPPPDPALAQTLWGLTFASPIGLAAGFDKDAEAFAGLLRVGFGFVEVGTVTPRPQAGNPRPRLFRLREDDAVINRMGFNNAGMDAAAARLRGRDRGAGIVGVNIGRNKDAADPIDDYRRCAACLAPLADYLVVNVSSPNTPGLREMQNRQTLLALVRAVRYAAGDGAGPPLLVKIAPDLTSDEIGEICAFAAEAKPDGLVISNTTTARPPDLKSGERAQTGGLSGAPLFMASTALLRDVYARTGGKIPLIGVGGVRDGETAYAKIRAGASLVQLYTALAYQGPDLVTRIQDTLVRCLRADGFAHLADAVGADHR